MQQIYLVTSGENEDYRVHGAFASIEDAERAKILWGFDQDESTEIEELDVLKIAELPELNGRHPFKVNIYDDEATYVHRGWCDRTSAEEGSTFSEVSKKHTVYIYAQDEEDAKKKAIAFLNK